MISELWYPRPYRGVGIEAFWYGHMVVGGEFWHHPLIFSIPQDCVQVREVLEDVIAIVSEVSCGRATQLRSLRIQKLYEGITFFGGFLVCCSNANLNFFHQPLRKLLSVHQGWARAPGGCVFPPPAAGLWGFCLCTLCTDTAWEEEASRDLSPRFHGDLLWSEIPAHLRRQTDKIVAVFLLTIIFILPPGVYWD